MNFRWANALVERLLNTRGHSQIKNGLCATEQFSNEDVLLKQFMRPCAINPRAKYPINQWRLRILGA